jgi:rhamnosyltransferase
MRFTLCLLTLNAQSELEQLAKSVERQSLRPDEVVLIDSSSTDQTVELARSLRYRVHVIERSAFGHGKTRQLAANMAADSDVVVYMTQDAVLAGEDSLKQLLAPFKDPEVAAVCGRQLPRPGAGAIERFARLYNYPGTSVIRTRLDIPTRGFKTIFFSNSFGAYRRASLMSVGGFPLHTEFGEDTQVVAKLILSGATVAYAADAMVYHSHPLSIRAEFDRYREIGRMHRSEAWLAERFGAPSGEGRRFVLAELGYLGKNAPHLVPLAILRTISKYVGYKTGYNSA